MRLVKCQACGKHNDYSKTKTCTKCGAELPELVDRIVFCKYSGLLCANPCGRSDVSPADGVYHICGLNTPPSTQCSAELPGEEERVILCKYSGLLCARPCGRYDKSPEDGVYHTCELNTPPGKNSEPS